jgi:hypothetical protein
LAPFFTGIYQARLKVFLETNTSVQNCFSHFTLISPTVRPRQRRIEASGGSTVVKLLTHKPKIVGWNLAAGTGREKNGEEKVFQKTKKKEIKSSLCPSGTEVETLNSQS